MNVESVLQLKRVIAQVQDHRHNIGDWKRCACGHATRDQWFRERGFASCASMAAAMAFFGPTIGQAHDLFAAPTGVKATPRLTMAMIDEFLAHGQVTPPRRPNAAERRQATIDRLLACADAGAKKARETVSTFVAVVF